MRFVSLSFVCAAAFVCGACGSSSGDDTNVSVADAGLTPTACAQDTRKDVYTAGLTKTTASNIALKVMSANPAPPQRDVNDLVLELLDASGNPLDGASLSVVPWMPDHGHGSSVKPTITPTGGGLYTITNLYYPMPGLWQLTMTVTPAGSTAGQTAVFNFCIDG